MTIRITYQNGTQFTTTIRAEAIAEVIRDLDASPNVEKWEVVKD